MAAVTRRDSNSLELGIERWPVVTAAIRFVIVAPICVTTSTVTNRGGRTAGCKSRTRLGNLAGAGNNELCSALSNLRGYLTWLQRLRNLAQLRLHIHVAVEGRTAQLQRNLVIIFTARLNYDAALPFLTPEPGASWNEWFRDLLPISRKD